MITLSYIDLHSYIILLQVKTCQTLLSLRSRVDHGVKRGQSALPLLSLARSALMPSHETPLDLMAHPADVLIGIDGRPERDWGKYTTHELNNLEISHRSQPRMQPIHALLGPRCVAVCTSRNIFHYQRLRFESKFHIIWTQINPGYGRTRRSRSQNKDGMEMEWRNIEQPPRKGGTEDRADGILDLPRFLWGKIPVHYGIVWNPNKPTWTCFMSNKCHDSKPKAYMFLI